MENENIKFYGNKSFYFVGRLKSTENLFKTQENKNYIRLNLPLFDNVSTVYCEAFSFGISDYIYSSVNGKWTKTQWSERNSSSVLKGMRYGDKFSYNGKEFSNNYDLIQAFKTDVENGNVKKDDMLDVRGNLELQVYNGEVQKRYVIKSITKAKQDDKPHFSLVAEVLVEKDSVKEVEDGVEIDALLLEFLKLDGEDKKHPRLIPQKLTYKMTNNAIKRMVMEKLKVDEGYKAVCFECNVFRSAGEVKVEPLTDEQKLYIELGFLTKEEAEKDNTVVDSNVTEELQVVKPVVKRQYKHISFVPDKEQSKEFMKGIEPKVDNVFDDAFGSSLIGDSDLDDFFDMDNLSF